MASSSSSPAQSREGDPLDVVAHFKDYQTRVTSSLVALTKTSGTLANQDLGFHRSANPQISRSLDRQNAHLLRLTNKLLKAATQDSTVKAPQPKSKDGIEDSWRSIVDVVDDLLEKADSSIDEYTGAIKRLSPAVSDSMPHPSPDTRGVRSFRGRHLDKPQLLFDRKVNNHETGQFKPLLLTKPHALVPLDQILKSTSSEYPHPYANEIEAFQYPQEVYQHAESMPYWPPEQEQATFVDTEVGVYTMLADLKNATEIAVDLEHHDLHTYRGLVSLMQISTREKDWIIDTLQPWREKLQVLNEVFTDPNIIKVFHGSASDMIWLQRDLGLYVVGLFDTYYACEALQFPGRSLKYLLQHFANVEAQKQYQLSDWRQRPLSQELLDYARSDTHYLLYIFDEVRNLLVQASTPRDNLIDYVLAGSKKEALQVYEQFNYNFESGRGSGGWYGLYLDKASIYTPQQFAVYKALHQWRDEMARELDESPNALLKNADLILLGEAMPKNMTEMYRAFRAAPGIFQDKSFKGASDVFGLIAKTMREHKDDPAVHEQIRQNELKYGVRPQNRWKKATSTPKGDRAQSQLTGLAATLQQVQSNGDLETTAPNTPHANGLTEAEHMPPRSQQSGLWGSVMPFMPLPFMDPMMAFTALGALLPLPDLSGDPFTVEEQQIVSAQVEDSAMPAPSSSVSTPIQDDTFTLRNLSSRKRKAEDSVEEKDDIDPFADQSLSSITDYDIYNKPGQGSAAVTSERAQAKQQRKAEKKARRTAELEEQDRKDRDMVPFDYDAEESVLAPKPSRTNGTDLPDKSKGKKHMNPFAKALDTGTGAKRNRLGQEGAGRSMTFKS